MHNITPAKRFYPYLCEHSDFLVFEGGQTVGGVRTFGDATRFLMKRFYEEFEGNTCPSLKALHNNRSLIESGIIATSANLAGHGMVPEDTLLDAVRDGFIDSSFYHHWHHYRWHCNGKTVYDVHPTLAKAFLETEMTIAPQVLRLERPTIYLGMPDLGLTIWHQTTGEHRLNGMYVSEDTHGDSPVLLIVVVGEAHEGECADNNALCSFSLPLDGESNVEDLVKNVSRNPRRIQLLGPNAKRFVDWARLALNALLYIEHVTEDAVHHADYGVPEKKLAHAQKIASKKQREGFLSRYRADVRYVRLGQGFARQGMAGSASEGSEAAVVRHLVRGHWRWQVCGKGRAERRLIWIKPHWRGDEVLAPPVCRTTKIVRVETAESP